MALDNPQYWVQDGTSGVPADENVTALWVGRILSDLGGTQLVISRSHASDDGIALYWDNASDQMSIVWFLDLGAGGFEQGIMASRMPLNTLCAAYWQWDGTVVRGGWLNLEDASASWVSAATANNFTGYGAVSHMSLSSNANGADMEAQIWRVWQDDTITEDELRLEAYSLHAVRRLNLYWDSDMEAGGASLPDKSGNGRDATRQAGATETAIANYSQIRDIVHEWNAAGFIVPAAGGNVNLFSGKFGALLQGKL